MFRKRVQGLQSPCRRRPGGIPTVRCGSPMVEVADRPRSVLLTSSLMSERPACRVRRTSTGLSLPRLHSLWRIAGRPSRRGLRLPSTGSQQPAEGPGSHASPNAESCGEVEGSPLAVKKPKTRASRRGPTSMGTLSSNSPAAAQQNRLDFIRPPALARRNCQADVRSPFVAVRLASVALPLPLHFRCSATSTGEWSGTYMSRTGWRWYSGLCTRVGRTGFTYARPS